MPHAAAPPHRDLLEPDPPDFDPADFDPAEIRIRVVGRTESMAEAIRIGNEVETLYTNGPAGGGGVWKQAKQVVAVVSTLIPQDRVRPVVSMQVA